MTMHVIHAREPIPTRLGNSIFLAGPTLRERTKICFECANYGKVRDETYRNPDEVHWRDCPTCDGTGRIGLRSWRQDALETLRRANFNGTVFVPEDRDWSFDESAEWVDQIAWEHVGLERATCIVFWVPRNMATLPGLTTNIEFGMYYDCGHCVFGAPQDAPGTRYMRYLAKKAGAPSFITLTATLLEAVERCSS